MNTNRSRRRPQSVVAGMCLLVCCSAWAGAEPFVFVVEAARDTSGGFRALALPEVGRRALVWPEGVVTVPDSLPWFEFGAAGLACALQPAALVGIGAGGRFTATAGSYRLDTPLLLTDDRVVAFMTAGWLDVASGGVTYRRPAVRRDTRGDYAILAGLILATAVLLRAIRRRGGRSQDRAARPRE